MHPELIIILALIVDFIFGDPKWFPHPVRGIGFLATHTEYILRKLIPNSLRLAGIFAALIVIGLSGFTAWILIYYTGKLNPVASYIMSILILYFSIAPRDLYNHAHNVFVALRSGNTDSARVKVAMIVGRDTANLDNKEIARAGVETVAESLVDGVTAPIFYAILFGPIGAFVYRAINTLDSMFGHKNERYLHFGWASARIDDLANYLSARITIPFIWLATLLHRYSIKNSIRIFFRDKRNHHSPNSGLSEAAFAGALKIQLGGTNYYNGIEDIKPLIGDRIREISIDDIGRSTTLMLSTTILFTITLCIIHYIVIKALL